MSACMCVICTCVHTSCVCVLYVSLIRCVYVLCELCGYVYVCAWYVSAFILWCVWQCVRATCVFTHVVCGCSVCVRALYIYVHMYVCMYVRMYECMYVWMNEWISINGFCVYVSESWGTNINRKKPTVYNNFLSPDTRLFKHVMWSTQSDTETYSRLRVRYPTLDKLFWDWTNSSAR